MQIKVNKKSALIKLSTQREVECFAQLMEYYMDTTFETPDDDGWISLVDSMAEKLNKKFNKEESL